MKTKVKEWMTTEFAILRSTQTVIAAMEILAGRPTQLGVVFDEDQPVTIVNFSELERLSNDLKAYTLLNLLWRFQPGVITAAQQNMTDFGRSGAFISLGRDDHGAIVVEGETVVGVLVNQAIDDFLRNELAVGSRLRSDYLLASGTIVTEPVIVHCEEYNHRNVLVYYDRQHPTQCQSEEPAIHFIKRGQSV